MQTAIFFHYLDCNISNLKFIFIKKKKINERATVDHQAHLANTAVKQGSMVLSKGKARKPKGLSRDEKLSEAHNFCLIIMADSNSKAFLQSLLPMSSASALKRTKCWATTKQCSSAAWKWAGSSYTADCLRVPIIIFTTESKCSSCKLQQLSPQLLILFLLWGLSRSSELNILINRY